MLRRPTEGDRHRLRFREVAARPAEPQAGLINVLVLVVLLGMQSRASAADVDFNRDVARVLAGHCLDCHNDFDLKGGLDLSTQQGARAGGDSGPVITGGKLDGSLLWQRVADDEMPPEAPLRDEDKQVLRRWIEAGAKWGGGPIDVFRYSSEHRAGYDWWSLRPLTRPRVPVPVEPSAGEAPAANSIDRFVDARLHAARLHRSPPADRRTLIRRLSFDLTGLPPSPEAVQRFIDDNAPDAYERLVDRLLASPAYGERWARHWLDVVRFGESQGFERDKLRENAWRYRDWVVDALNNDMPYDEFARMQLAGDVIEEAGPQGAIAAGFLVAGPWDEVGQKQQSAAMKRVVRQDELEDYISAVGQTFLGLTINCARCHDHKFDPVRQSEYYRLAAALNGVRHGERTLDLPMATDTAAIRTALTQLEQRLERRAAPIRERLLAERQRKATTTTPPPTPIARWTFDDSLADEIGPLDGEAQGAASVHKSRLRLDGKTGYVITAPLERDLTAKTLEVWIQLGTLEQRGGGVISLQTLDGSTFDAIVFGEQQPRRWMAGSNSFVRTQSFEGPEESDADSRVTHIAITWHADGTIAGYRNGLPYGKPYQSTDPVTFRAGEAQIVFGLRHSPPGGNRFLAGQIEQAQLHDRALTPEEVAASAGVMSDFVSDEQIVAELTPAQQRTWQQWRFEADHLRKQLDRAESTSVYTVDADEQPQTMRIMLRGDPATPGDAVSPGGVASVLPGAADFGLPDDATDAQRRRALAEWITRPDNPLFARVMVNRLWHYHFGAGFVPTPSDLGFSGGEPTHPELLDWLASEFIAGGYSLKDLHRLIVTSATYRQSSLPREDALAADAQNRWLWRMSPRRLEAESVRDAILVIAGALNDEVGGPGYYDFTTYTRNTQFYELVDPVGASFNRRSLYRCWVRSGRSPFLDVFDCPDPSTKTPSRAVTTTPLQSLALLNNSFVLRMSDRLAQRLKETPPSPPQERRLHIHAERGRGAGGEGAGTRIEDRGWRIAGAAAGVDTSRDGAVATTSDPLTPALSPTTQGQEVGTSIVGERGSVVADQVDRAFWLAYSRSASDDEQHQAAAFIEAHGLPAFCRVLFNTNEFLYVE
jgi:hypothetical protein